MDVRNPNPDRRPPTLSTNEARQGITGHNVRYVLIAGITAVVVLFALIWLYYFGW